MDDQQLLRYSRQILLPQIGVEGQRQLLEARVLIVGAGGLGSAAALYLASAGVGDITIADHDKVELSNLQRQILHREKDIGRRKVDSARDTLTGLNPDIKVTGLEARLDAEQLATLIGKIDLVIDGSDNFNTRFAVNEACVASRTPLVSGAAIRLEGQVSVFTNQPGEPCYQCLYGGGGELDGSCSENGVLAPLVGIIGSIQATEAIKVLTGAGTPLSGRLLLLDALEMQWRSLRLKADPKCPVCSGR